MTLFINNDDVKRILTMDLTIQALEESSVRMIQGEWNRFVPPFLKGGWEGF